jgi:hypothetical protein
MRCKLLARVTYQFGVACHVVLEVVDGLVGHLVDRLLPQQVSFIDKHLLAGVLVNQLDVAFGNMLGHFLAHLLVVQCGFDLFVIIFFHEDLSCFRLHKMGNLLVDNLQEECNGSPSSHLDVLHWLMCAQFALADLVLNNRLLNYVVVELEWVLEGYFVVDLATLWFDHERAFRVDDVGLVILLRGTHHLRQLFFVSKRCVFLIDESLSWRVVSWGSTVEFTHNSIKLIHLDVS